MTNFSRKIINDITSKPFKKIFMKKYLINADYFKKIEGYMREISNLSQSTDEIKNEFFSSLEILQSNTGGKILLLFMEVCLQFFSRLMPILLSSISTPGNLKYNQVRMAKINLYIQDHLSKDIKEKEIADSVGMSTEYFSRFFRKMYSCSFIEYLNRCKVNFAARLLHDTDFSIIDICYKSGFSSPNQFNRVFKKVISMTPSEYREQRKRDREKVENVSGEGENCIE